jgi:predicted RNA binding protein YcfA (HicA-like mRNA interferase family)
LTRKLQLATFHQSQPLVDSRTVIKRLQEQGWHLVRTKGSHRHFRHPERTGMVTVPHPVHDLPQGTLKGIERQSGVRMRARADRESD